MISILVFDKNTHDLATYIYTPLDKIVRSTYHPVLILKATKKTYHLARHICDNMTALTKKKFVFSILGIF